MPNGLYQNLIANFLNRKEAANLTLSCANLYTIYQPALTKRRLQRQRLCWNSVRFDKLCHLNNDNKQGKYD